MTAPLRLDELGSVQFAALCRELVGQEATVAAEPAPWGFAAALPDGVMSPAGRQLAGPALVLAVWLRDGARSADAAGRLQRIVQDSTAAAPTPPASVLLLTNVAEPPAGGGGGELVAVGPHELWALVRGRASLRYRLPSLLGVSDLSLLLPAEPWSRSSGDVDAAAAVARVFVPTRAYAQALGVLEQHRFVVLSGPPEMGKTAIARILGLAALSDGWELHECVRPDELWQRHAADRRQLFIADDAFGSTEYRPDTAERWALELDRVLQTLDDGHRLIWTSRPTPLHAALRRIHREHGVERFPQPAHVAVDAAALDVGEKALMLFRHTKALGAPDAQVELVRRHGWEIVSHPHFTPERIRRFCTTRLATLAATRDEQALVAAVTAEIREPTTAMAASYRALPREHRDVLHALVDMPPGRVAERDLAVALRRHATQGLVQPLPRVLDRLADHFLRIAGGGITWVHPSWRDLVIEELAGDRQARAAFLRGCGVHGVALALSTAGGAAGERALPLLREDEDWDTLGGRVADVLPGLDPPEVALLLETLAEALRRAPASGTELRPLAEASLAHLGRLWDAPSTPPVPVGLLGAWLSLAARLPAPPPAPKRALARAWIELAPGDDAAVATAAEVAALDDWLALAERLVTAAPELLDRFGFPDAQTGAVGSFVLQAHETAARLGPATRMLLVRTLERVARLFPALAHQAARTASELAHVAAPPPAPEPQLRGLSPELEALLAQPLASTRHEQAIVTRVLRDL